MGRLDELRRFVTKDALGIEVAPYFNPTVSKADGYNVLIVDVFDTDKLRGNARGDPNIPDDRITEIEEVDLVSDASQLLDIVRSKDLCSKVDYIVSSHNFEHLPDPISFLQGCSEALVPGGVLTMAIPDCRACFDHFRMPTRLSDWLSAYHRGLTQPSPENLFDHASNHAPHSLEVNRFIPVRNLKAAYDQYLSDIDEPGSYRDTHCSVVFGESFELMVRDLKYLGLIDLEVVEISPSMGIEFFAHLRKPDAKANNRPADQSEEVFFAKRLDLMRQTNFYGGSKHGAKGPENRRAKRLARKILGPALMQNLSDLNARRRAKRKSSSK
ncbi:MAG: adenine phosphoribosyltransferase [Paracoccaceae bacterium]|nr:adenine phosphoribosyltransferase [Paracoccaceae bacterium]